MLNLDCDHYINNSKAAREAMCFLMDPQLGKKLCYVQFPQRFDGIDLHDRYANRNVVFFDVSWSNSIWLLLLQINSVFFTVDLDEFAALESYLNVSVYANPRLTIDLWSIFQSLILICFNMVLIIDQHERPRWDSRAGVCWYWMCLQPAGIVWLWSTSVRETTQDDMWLLAFMVLLLLWWFKEVKVEEESWKRFAWRSV